MKWTYTEITYALGCGALRIKRHDTLCKTIFHWLLLDNAGVRRERRCSSESMSRPGDIYQPDFSLGKPAYFNVSVRNSFTPTHLINADIRPGAAAEAGESEKDERYDDTVSSNGCLFFPVIVEYFGVWSSHSLEVLESIVKRSSVTTGLSLSKVSSDLHKQLSVRLWQHNSSMLTNVEDARSFDVDRDFDYYYSNM